MKNNLKHLWKVFVLLFVLFAVIINWGHVAKVLPYFDWKVISAKAADLMPDFVRADYFDYFSTEGRLVIPKLNIKAPLFFVKQNSHKQDFDKILKQGVLHYPDSALPGEQGTALILGHSAPLFWPKINYDWVFTDLDKLTQGDEIIVYFQGNKHIYIVESQNILPKQSISANQLWTSDVRSDNHAVLALSTCWPPGKDDNRLVILADLAP